MVHRETCSKETIADKLYLGKIYTENTLKQTFVYKIFMKMFINGSPYVGKKFTKIHLDFFFLFISFLFIFIRDFFKVIFNGRTFSSKSLQTFCQEKVHKYLFLGKALQNQEKNPLKNVSLDFFFLFISDILKISLMEELF